MSLVRFNNRMMTPGIFDFLNDVIGEDLMNMNGHRVVSTMPAVNIKETDKAFELDMTVPGIDKKDISVEVEEDVLKIVYAKEDEKKEENENFSRREFHYNSFEKRYTLPEEVDGSKIEAKQENGVLHISIPKKEAKPVFKKMIKVA